MSNFPQLLKRSNFASFDPSITRVYTSTPSSTNRYGDFGLKYPVHRPKGPRYIRVNRLDVGHLLGSDWRSAETEARFVQSHGTGRTPWRNIDETSARPTANRSIMWDSAPVEEDKLAQENTEYMHDVNVMNPRHFERYASKVRRYRMSFLDGKIQSLVQGARDNLNLPEDRTFVNLAAKGLAASKDTINFQVALAENEIEVKDDKGRSRLQSVPHQLYGLAYSRLPSIASETNPVLYQPGRQLDPAGMAYNSRNTVHSRTVYEGTNKSWVVSVGGAAAESTSHAARTSDDSGAVGTDFTREHPERGQGLYTIKRATIYAPPRPQNTSATQKSTGPLSHFKFNMTVQPATESQREAASRVGTKSYTATGHESRGSTDLGSSSVMDGGFRRVGSVLGTLRKAEQAQNKRQSVAEKNKKIRDILASLSKRTQRGGQ